jgi:hypothetical protein
MAIALPCTRGSNCAGCAINTYQPNQPTQHHQSSQSTQSQEIQPVYRQYSGQATQYQPRFRYESQTLNDAFRHQMLQYMQARYPPRIHMSGTANNWLDRIPHDTLDRITQYLSYEDRIYLRQQTRALYAAVNPQAAPWTSKVAFVLHAERDFVQHDDKHGRNIGCYTCFTVQPAREFAQNQRTQAFRRDLPGRPLVNLHRFCIRCGIKEGLHVPGDLLRRKNAEYSWICGCLEPRDHDLVPTCGICRRNAPMRESVPIG